MSRIRTIRRPMHYEKKKSLYGLLFCLPWLIGFVYFFLISLGEAVLYSLSTVTFSPTGLNLEFVGFRHYVDAFTADSTFLQSLTDALYTLVYQLPMVMVFSVCLGLILNAKFKGRLLVRGIFFLPVIIASGVVMEILSGDTISSSMMSGARSSVLFQGIEFGGLLLKMGIPESVTQTLMNVVNGIFSLVWRSGVQTLLLVSGLQSVPKTVYESAQIEGATAWETFWKITFPLISPILVLSVFYTIVDLATNSSNRMVILVLNASRSARMDYSAMSSLVWCAVVLAFAGFAFLLFRKHIYYMDDRG